MITAVDILNEIESDVSSLNGEVVRRALRGHSDTALVSNIF